MEDAKRQALSALSDTCSALTSQLGAAWDELRKREADLAAKEAELERQVNTHLESARRQELALKRKEEEHQESVRQREAAVSAVEEAVKKKEAELEQQRARFEREAAFVADANARAMDLVRLNVGDERQLTVARSTLMAVPGSLLAAMFSGRHMLRKDENHRVFLDRDPVVFGYVLDWLRAGAMGNPLDFFKGSDAERQRLKDELLFFQLLSPEALEASPSFAAGTPTLLELFRQDGAVRAVDLEPCVSFSSYKVTDAAVGDFYIAAALNHRHRSMGWVDPDRPSRVQVWHLPDLRTYNRRLGGWISGPSLCGRELAVVVGGEMLVVMDASDPRLPEKECYFFGHPMWKASETARTALTRDYAAVADCGRVGLLVWSRSTKERLFACPNSGYGGGYPQLFSDDANFLLSLHNDGHIHLIDFETEKRHVRCRIPLGAVSSLCLAGPTDGKGKRTIAVAARDYHPDLAGPCFTVFHEDDGDRQLKPQSYRALFPHQPESDKDCYPCVVPTGTGALVCGYDVVAKRLCVRDCVTGEEASLDVDLPVDKDVVLRARGSVLLADYNTRAGGFKEDRLVVYMPAATAP